MVAAVVVVVVVRAADAAAAATDTANDATDDAAVRQRHQLLVQLTIAGCHSFVRRTANTRLHRRRGVSNRRSRFTNIYTFSRAPRRHARKRRREKKRLRKNPARPAWRTGAYYECCVRTYERTSKTAREGCRSVACVCDCNEWRVARARPRAPSLGSKCKQGAAAIKCACARPCWCVLPRSPPRFSPSANVAENRCRAQRHIDAAAAPSRVPTSAEGALCAVTVR